MAVNMKNIPLESVLSPFVGKNTLRNSELFEQLALDLELPESVTKARTNIGSYNVFKRTVRWHQQTLKQLGILERVDRGVWRLTRESRDKLTHAPTKRILLAFSTDLGCALWANAEDVFTGLGEQITLAFTSPPYPLAKQRAYGGVDRHQYVDWLLSILEPIVKLLRPGGNIVLNLGNDIFETGSPARSLYIEQLTLALHEKLGLHLMERFVWHNPSKPPGPVYWASIKRIHHNTTYEHVLWFTNDPHRVVANNRRCLQEHTEQHLRLMNSGGIRKHAEYAGGAYAVRPGSFGTCTEGAIPRNVLTIPHRDPDQAPARKFAKENDLPTHPALMPSKLADHFVRFLSDAGDLIVDPFGGWATTGRGAEINNRRWLITEKCREYLISAAHRFCNSPGFKSEMVA